MGAVVNCIKMEGNDDANEKLLQMINIGQQDEFKACHGFLPLLPARNCAGERAHLPFPECTGHRPSAASGGTLLHEGSEEPCPAHGNGENARPALSPEGKPEEHPASNPEPIPDQPGHGGR